MSDAQSKALFVDRDGILNEIVLREGNIHSPRHWDEIKLFSEMERLREIKSLGFLIIMITNQPDVERGIVSAEFLAALHGDFMNRFSLDACYVCPFASDDHPDKKPNPGMFLKAIREWKIDAASSFHLGDTERDTLSAERVGCRSIVWDRPYNQEVVADFRISAFNPLFSIVDQRIKKG